MNISPKQLKAFIAIAETGSFTEACATLHLSQPALSIAIRNLEETLGGKLIARTTRALGLTPEGEVFLPVARRLLADWDGALSDAHSLFAKRRGKLRIAAMPSFATSHLPPILRRYHDQYPNISVSIEDVVAENVVDQVRSGKAEIGVAFMPTDRGDDLEFKPLFTDRFVAALPPDHPLAEHKIVSWAALTKSPLLLLQKPSSIRMLIEKSLAANDIPLTIGFEAHQLVTLGRMVACGLGVSVVPTLCRDQFKSLGVICRPLGKPVVSREVSLVMRRRYPLSAAAQAMLEILEDYFHLDA
ncbi:MAG: LysR family transcriptional regulator [Spongiibacteraceae bacterium]